MLISYLVFELVVLVFSLAMLIRPRSAIALERRIALALRRKKRETTAKPIHRWEIIVTMLAGAGLATLVLTDWSGLRICRLNANVETSTVGNMSPELMKKVDALVIPEIKSGKHMGLVVGITDHGRTWIRGYGRRSVKDHRAPDGDSVYEIGSITKTFTCTSLAVMAEAGQVKLNDPVSRYLPASVHVPSKDSRQITLQDLATHTSGLPRVSDNSGLIADFSSDPYSRYGEDKLYEFLNGHKLRSRPGTQYEYSNLGMGLLGFALTRKAGENYERMVTRLVCRPLGLVDTCVTLTAQQKARLAEGNAQQERLGQILFVVPADNWTFQDTTAGAGALRSTAKDMLKYLEENMNPPEGVLGRAMENAQKPMTKCDDMMRSGLGWVLIDAPWVDEPVIWHDGGTGGYCSFVGFCKKRELGIVVLSNSSGDVDLTALRILKTAVQEDRQ